MSAWQYGGLSSSGTGIWHALQEVYEPLAATLPGMPRPHGPIARSLCGSLVFQLSAVPVAIDCGNCLRVLAGSSPPGPVRNPQS